MAHVPGTVMDILKEPDILASMHMLAERHQKIYYYNHALIAQLAHRAFGLSGEMYASLGVGVQEVLADLVEPESPRIQVVAHPNTLITLTGQDDNVADLIFDVTAGFQKVEPETFEAVEEITASHLEEKPSRDLALFGAALSHSIQLSQQILPD